MHASQGRHHSLFVVPNGKLQMPWNNTLLLVVARSVTCEFEDLRSQVFEYCREVYYAESSAKGIASREYEPTWCSCTYALGVVSPLEETVHTTDWELEAGL